VEGTKLFTGSLDDPARMFANYAILLYDFINSEMNDPLKFI